MCWRRLSTKRLATISFRHERGSKTSSPEGRRALMPVDFRVFSGRLDIVSSEMTPIA